MSPSSATGESLQNITVVRTTHVELDDCLYCPCLYPRSSLEPALRGSNERRTSHHKFGFRAGCETIRIAGQIVAAVKEARPSR